MTDETSNTPAGGAAPAGGDAAATGDKPKAPPLAITAQYVRDLSFENPRAPQSLVQSNQQQGQPNVNVGVEVSVRQLQEKLYEVILQMRTEAKQGDDALFLAELHYAGIFQIGEVPPEVVQILLFVEAPRMLFPFGRHIVAEAIRDGGFPPMMLQPVDFAAMYKQRLERAQAEQKAKEGAGANGDAASEGKAETA